MRRTNAPNMITGDKIRDTPENLEMASGSNTTTETAIEAAMAAKLRQNAETSQILAGPTCSSCDHHDSGFNISISRRLAL